MVNNDWFCAQIENGEKIFNPSGKVSANDVILAFLLCMCRLTCASVCSGDGFQRDSR